MSKNFVPVLMAITMRQVIENHPFPNFPADMHFKDTAGWLAIVIYPSMQIEPLPYSTSHFFGNTQTSPSRKIYQPKTIISSLTLSDKEG